uniref:Matrix remodeling-associated protein 8-like n=1 Tax=Sander lucioperca TaxID=283035 RepID=A0A8C9YTG2_SANLU
MAPVLFLLVFLSGAASDPIVVTVNPGDDVTLSCQAADSSISVVKWSRPDLEPDTVLFYSDGRLDPDNQNPSFKDRVELVDRDLKDGNVSLILKNVNRHDTGTYTCGVKTGDTDPIRTITTIRTIRTVHLQVPERGSEDRNSSPGGRDGGLAAGVLVVLVLVAAAVGGVLMYRRRQKKRPGPPAASPDLTVTVYPGDDVILPCQAAGSSIRTLKWTREDLDPDTVLLYRDGDLKLDHQHPDFKDRVELVDRDLKDGDVSLILKNVSRHDTGTYECRVKTDDSDLIRTIRIICLQVKDLTVVTVDPGDDVILPCQAAGSSIRAVKWTKRDLKPTDNVLLYRDGHLETDDQNPSFKDRVELVDRDLEDGDVSLKLMNVNRHDAGIYECRVASGDSFRFIRILRLQVPEPAVPVMITPLLEVSSMD